MKTLSDKIIAFSLIVALIITAAGTWVNLNKLGKIGSKYTRLTGAITKSEGLSLEIEEKIGLEITDGVINFGEGYFDPNCKTKVATLYSKDGHSSCWLNSSGQIPSAADLAQSHLIENSGEVPLILKVYSKDKANAEEFLCGKNNGCPSQTALVKVTSWEHEPGSCSDHSLANLTEILTPDNNLTVTLCSQFSSANESNELFVSYYLVLPANAPPGTKTWTVIYEGTTAK